jgi:hypothetical protein
MCRFHRRPAKSTRTRLVRLFKKGTDRSVHWKCASDGCEIVDWGQSGQSPFLNRECRWRPWERSRENWISLNLSFFANRERRWSALSAFPALRVCAGGPDSSSGGRPFPLSGRRILAVCEGGRSRWIWLSCTSSVRLSRPPSRESVDSTAVLPNRRGRGWCVFSKKETDRSVH